ncbi:FIG00652936: hypothetical protein [hydrothermal vent metagenome]|jgi:Family of unknown function (DUF6146)|uniref:Lipoprotein n=1 Tax=hydrothermal vent metagenome TaxID=652676 RepID=A0A3B0QS52_9ZZZZ
MKNYIIILLVSFGVYSCKTPQKINTSTSEVRTATQDTVRIANDKLEYEIIIIEPGFNFWLQSVAKPEGYYSQSFLEGRNWLYVVEWNIRVLDPQRYDPNLYELQIDYNPSIDYGYEVNYKLYYYFIYFQLHYKQQLTGFVPRI